LANAALSVPEAAQFPGVEERRVTLDGITWRYLRAGSGPALVLVHGLMGFSWSWRLNMEELGRYFTVYAPDLPGCGFSQRADCLPGSLESDAAGLLQLLDYLGVQEFNLLGTSRGGGVATVLAGLLAQRGETHRLRRMVLSAPINPWSSFGQLRARLLAHGVGQFYTLYGAKRTPYLFGYYFRRLYGDAMRIVPGSMEGYRAGLEPSGSFRHLLHILRHWFIGLDQVGKALPLLRDLPILLLWGELDRAVYPSSAYELHRRLPNSTVLMMKGVGHLPYEETPDDFNRIVSDFFLRYLPRTPLEISGGAANGVPVATANTTESVPLGRGR
jgi:pimeloyl-ACP methyl ester carboxylesterase